jgi:hypothetical protein
MRLRRKIVTAAVSVVCGLALAACGQQVVAHVSAADTVHSALDGVLTSPTARFVITAQDLPGTASLADGSFSVVVTTSQRTQSSPAAEGQPIELSVYHESADLADLLQAGGSVYFRVDVKDIAAFTGTSEYGAIASKFNKVSSRPGYGFVHDILLGKWVGISMPVYLALYQKILAEEIGMQKQVLKLLPSGSPSPNLSELQAIESLTHNTAKLKALRLDISSSLAQSVQTWLSIHQRAGDEYSLDLPVRPFVGSLVERLLKPLESFVKGVTVSKTEIATDLQRIPSGLSVNADVWIQKGSVTKIQAFIPTTSAYLLIGVSHPATAVTAPSDATMLTAADLKALVPDLGQTAVPNIPLGNSGTAVSGIATQTATSSVSG